MGKMALAIRRSPLKSRPCHGVATLAHPSAPLRDRQAEHRSRRHSFGVFGLSSTSPWKNLSATRTKANATHHRHMNPTTGVGSTMGDLAAVLAVMGDFHWISEGGGSFSPFARALQR